MYYVNIALTVALYVTLIQTLKKYKHIPFSEKEGGGQDKRQTEGRDKETEFRVKKQEGNSVTNWLYV